mmetsp:Transcript_15671/g.50219  ORF Transcript_15671/g.50219 Transcript_15671/m.50219 type:complete len:287 (+) Transcript_15671:494-1354(+)
MVPPDDGTVHRRHLRRAPCLLLGARPHPAQPRPHPRRPPPSGRLARPRGVVDGAVGPRLEAGRGDRRRHPHRLALPPRRPPDLRVWDLLGPAPHLARDPAAARGGGGGAALAPAAAAARARPRPPRRRHRYLWRLRRRAAGGLRVQHLPADGGAAGARGLHGAAAPLPQLLRVGAVGAAAPPRPRPHHPRLGVGRVGVGAGDAAAAAAAPRHRPAPPRGVGPGRARRGDAGQLRARPPRLRAPGGRAEPLLGGPLHPALVPRAGAGWQARRADRAASGGGLVAGGC